MREHRNRDRAFRLSLLATGSDASGRSDAAEARNRAVTLRTWTNIRLGSRRGDRNHGRGALATGSAPGGPARASSNLALGPDEPALPLEILAGRCPSLRWKDPFVAG